jgi:predicted GNAT family acetyltransferase
MDIIRCDKLEQLRHLSLPYLAQHEAEHGLLVGIILGVSALPDGSLAAVVVDRDRVHGVALRLDHRTIVSRVDDAKALDLLASAVAEDSRTMTVAGASRSVAAISERSRRAITFTMDQGVYETKAVRPPRNAPDGRRRGAEQSDRDILIDAHLELNASLGATETRDEAAVSIERLIGSGNLSVWETPVGDVVCTAGTAGPTLHGIRVNYVYTPRDRRGKGYASALVADLTQASLDDGRSFVFLHADRANPTATALYERLGYEHIADFTMIRYPR